MKTKKLPNESGVLVLGILSICFCAAWGIPGLILGIISLVLYKKDKVIYETDPVAYEQSYKNANAGKICAIIGVSLSAFTFLFILIYFLIIGTLFAGVFSTVNNVLEYEREHRKYYNDSLANSFLSDSTYNIANDTIRLDIEDTSKVH